MGGVRIGGRAFVEICSPPWTAYQGPGGFDDVPQVFSACSSNAPGEATVYTDFDDFTVTDQNHNPVISPDGTKILFEVLSASTGFREIWVVDAIPNSTATQLVASASQYCFHPAWGPDSDTFVYVLGSGGALDQGSIYKDTVSAPGSPTLLRAPSGGAGCFRPQFNFDGSRVAYLYTAAGDPQLRCMDDDGTNDGMVDNTLSIYDSNEPPQFSWALTQNLIAFHDAQATQDGWVIDDTGAGKTQINLNGDLAGAGVNISGRAWAPSDEFVVLTANVGNGRYDIYRAEVDGSDSTLLTSVLGATLSPSYLRGALVYGGLIWFISETNLTTGDGVVAYIPLTGGAGTVVFDSALGAGDDVQAFTGGDGWYVN